MKLPHSQELLVLSHRSLHRHRADSRLRLGSMLVTEWMALQDVIISDRECGATRRAGKHNTVVHCHHGAARLPPFLLRPIAVVHHSTNTVYHTQDQDGCRVGSLLFNALKHRPTHLFTRHVHPGSFLSTINIKPMLRPGQNLHVCRQKSYM